ncbi:hypothetical protein [Marinicella sp. W31]|uniref:hypothetical protein n=1 Tax=Marinicella sp. W31 TaxID=3023713 RepID=UPI00375673AA
MKTKIWILMGLLSSLFLQGCSQVSGPRLEDPTPTPLILYQANGQYFKATDLAVLRRVTKLIAPQLEAGDPSPQPSVVAAIEGLIRPVPQLTIDGFGDFNVDLEIRQECSFNGAYRDRRGNLIEPQEQSQAAIDCGCSYLDQFCAQASGHGYTRCLFDATLVANRVFEGGECRF